MSHLPLVGGLPLIGQVTAANNPASPTLGAITEDRVAFAALIITSSGQPLRLRAIESMETEKRENGDAGTWSFTAPLAVNEDAAAVIGPMDLVALYAVRVQSDLIGRSTSPLDVLNVLPKTSNIAADTVGGNSAPLGGPAQSPASGYTYGSADATIIANLGADSANCLMIGMIDRVEENYDFDAASLTLTVYGRDLTKVLIDNDVYVPYTVAAGGESGIASLLAGVSLAKATSGTEMLLDILDIFVAKDPNRLAQVLTDATVASGDALNSIAQYGYPWRNFLRADALIAGFHHLGDGQFPQFAVQSGSAWTNITELRNFPITRLFVDEIGRLIFDDTWNAWGFGEDAKLVSVGPDGNARQLIVLANSDVRSATFSQADDNVVTGISIQAAAVISADVELASFPTFSAPSHVATSTILVYGYRFTPFVSLYDAANAYSVTPTGAPLPTVRLQDGTLTPDTTKNALAARYPLLWTLHNNLWEATFVVRGSTKWRVGNRLSTTLGGRQAATQPQPGLWKEWYIMSVTNSLSFGSDWTTTIKARFPLDPVIVPDTPSAANVTGGNAAPL